MKKLVLLPFLALALIFNGCNKPEDETTPQSASGEGEVVFTGQTVETNQLKDGTDLDRYAEYARITIDGIEYVRDVYYINDIPYTQAIKLLPGIYTVEKFLMMDDSLQTPNDTTDDVILYSTPEFGSEYADYVNKPLSFDIDVVAFEKNEIFIEVLRFLPSLWEEFGFDWFVIEESIIREHCFFGDLCVKNPLDYEGSLYAQQANGLQMDMPAIAYIDVYQSTSKDSYADTVLTGSFSNAEWNGDGAPLCVHYEDYNMFDDAYRLELFILVADGNDFNYKHFLTWEFTDQNAAAVLNAGDDGVTDYVLGTCVPDADFMIPPYMNLPATATFLYESAAPGANTHAYFDAQISNVGNGYEITDGLYPGWCFDYLHLIDPNTSYNMAVYSSLYPNLMPDFIETKPWDKANWLMNHLDWYDGYEWDDIQGALWTILGWTGNSLGGISGQTALAEDMAADANSYGGGYMPLPGGWAAVIFVHDQTVQTVFIVVDP